MALPLNPKRSKDDNLKQFFNTSMTDTISNWTIPRSFGVDTEGTADENCSIFAQEVYINAASEYEKAILFLMSLTGNGKNSFGIDMSSCIKRMKEVDSNGKKMFKLLPYTFILLLGGYSFWEKTCNNEQYFRIGKSSEDDAYYKSRVTQVF